MKSYFDKSYYLPVQKYRGKIEHIHYPCYASLKLDGELTYIIKKGEKILSVNKAKYGRWRFDYPALNEFAQLDLEDGIYLAELFWNEGRTKEDFYGFLSRRESDELNLGLWGVLETKSKKDFITEETYRFLSSLKNKVKEFKHLIIVPFWFVKSVEELSCLAKQILSEGWEGLVVRNVNAIYREGQSINWIKIKRKEREIEEKERNEEDTEEIVEEITKEIVRI